MTGRSRGGVDEQTVARLWEQQSFPEAALRDSGFTVIFRGIPSDAGGPDYQDALIRTPAGIVGGDVEFHVDSAEWRSHGHHRNPAYNRVILHVVWQHSGEPALCADGREVPVVAIGPYMSAHFATRQPSLLREPCVERLARLPHDAVAGRVREAGLARLGERASRFAADIDATSANDALYIALFESLGYASNREVFRRLAEYVPFGWLMSTPSDMWKDILLDAAGLGPPAPVAPPARLPAGAWRLERLRPANHPARRLCGIADVLGRLAPDPCSTALAPIREGQKPAKVRALFLSPGAQAHIGRGRADEMVVSVLLPFAAGAGESEAAERLFLSYPSPPANRWTRLMTGRLQSAGRDLKVRTAAEHQGLHHIYHRHCRTQRRDGCPLCR